MSDREKNKEKPTETGSSQQDSANNTPAKPQGYGTVPVQKECNKSKPPSYGTTQRNYAEDTKNITSVEQPLNKDK